MLRGFGLACAILGCLCTSASGQNDQLAACERFAIAFSKKQGGALARVQIERGNSLSINRFDDKVGTQAVSVEYVGYARLTDQSGAKRQRFICLHEGERGRAVYFGIFQE